MQDFKKFKVWEKAHLLTIAVYRVTEDFPKEETYGLTSQIRQASASIPANIAEGCGREGHQEFSRFLQIAMGSVYELEYHILLAHDLKILGEKNFDILNNDVTEVRKMLLALMKKIKGVTSSE